MPYEPIEHRPGTPVERHSATDWAKVLAGFYGALELDAPGSGTIEGRMLSAEIWDIRLCRIEMSPHSLAVSTELARPGTHLLNVVRFQTQGRSVFRQDGRSVPLEPGDCMAFNLTRPHSFSSTEDTSYDLVIIPNALVRQQSVPVEMLWAKKISRADRDDLADLAQHIVDMILRTRPVLPGAPAASMAHALMSLLSNFFARNEISTQGFTRAAMMRFRAKSYIDDHLRDADLKVDHIAAALRCSTRYIYTIFQEEGTSVQKYIWQSRVERCREELESPSGAIKSITDIAFSWGFSSASHFTRLFRQAYGTPPSAVKARVHPMRGAPLPTIIAPPRSSEE